ncbi:MAG TPA: MCE family protein [Micromonosporaceae bacterium]
MTNGSPIARRLLGLGFVVALAAALSLSVLTYRKAFTPVEWVTLHASHTGMQLNEGAEVKMRGVVVGEVRSISADGHNATLRLALDPKAAALIPANVTARLLPKTLFGEKYVALVPPAQSSPYPIRSGAVIDEDRSLDAIELERVLNETLDMLQAIQPDKLAATLGSLAYALRGRGETLGQDIVTADSYLKAMNAQMPTLQHDVKALADVLSTYDGAMPDLLSLLRDATVTARTVSDQRDQLAAFLANTTDLGDDTRLFLDRYGDRLIQLGKVSRPVLDVLAAYSPNYPCLLRGALALQPNVEDVFASGAMHITLETTRDNGKYEPGRDAPRYGATNGPYCAELPNPPVPAPEYPVNDGYDHKGGSRTPTPPLSVGALISPSALALNDPTMGYAGTAEEQALVKPLLAATAGVPADQVPDVAVLLWGPLLRGSVVNVT